jgi:AcrR family transcriptional regulator
MRGKQRVREAKQALYRDLVLEAAERVFAAEGYDAAKIEEIAREAGLSLGTVYTVFAGKAQVFRAVHERHAEELLRRGLEPAQRESDPLAALLAGVRGYIGYFVEHPDFLRMNLQEGATWGVREAGARGRVRNEAWSRGVELLGEALASCIEGGQVHAGEPRLLARMMIAMQQVQLAHWIETGMAEPPESVVERIADDARRLFGKVSA